VVTEWVGAERGLNTGDLNEGAIREPRREKEIGENRPSLQKLVKYPTDKKGSTNMQKPKVFGLVRKN